MEYDDKETTGIGEFFYYRIGNVETNKVWLKPTWGNIQRLLTYIRYETDICDRYGVYIMGGVTWDITSTWDLDIQLVSKHFTLDILESDIDTIHDYSLNTLGMLTDVQWRDKPKTLLTKTQLINNGFKDELSMFVKVVDVEKIINNKTFKRTADELMVDDNEFNLVKLNKNLMLMVKQFYTLPDKIKNRILSCENEVIRFDFHIDEILELTEQEFDQIKNK